MPTRTRVLSSSTRTARTDTSSMRADGSDNRIIVEVDIPTTSEYEDADNHIRCEVQHSTDNGATWNPIGGYTWDGGRYVNKDGVTNPNPIAGWQGGTSWGGDLVRARITPLKRVSGRLEAGSMTCGCWIETKVA